MSYPEAVQQKAAEARTTTRQLFNALLWLVVITSVLAMPAVVIHVWRVLL